MRCLAGRHAFISYEATQSLPIAMEVCQSFALDNGAFTVWRQGRTPDWRGYYQWVESIMNHPGFDFAVIPDVIDGSEEENDKLLANWPHSCGVPVWHLHESIARLERLADNYPRVALGSSGHYSSPGSEQWWMRISQAMKALCDDDGHPRTKLHGLRMLNPEIFRHLPLSSADSTNVAQNMGLSWRGAYEPATKSTKAIVIAERIETSPFATRWVGNSQQRLFA